MTTKTEKNHHANQSGITHSGWRASTSYKTMCGEKNEPGNQQRNGGQQEPPDSQKLRWWVLVLFLFGVTVNYITRNSLGILAPELKTSLGITTEQYSWIVGAFQLALHFSSHSAAG